MEAVARALVDLMSGTQVLSWADLTQLFVHFALLSFLAIGGAITTVPDMHRLVVGEWGWLNDAQFSGSVALAQAAPGPNVLFVAVIAFNAGGLPGAAAALTGTLLPTTLLSLGAARWGEQRRDTLGLQAFIQGMAPVTIGMLASTGWVLTEPSRSEWMCLPLVGATVWLMVRTRISPLWMIGAGALIGLMGWI